MTDYTALTQQHYLQPLNILFATIKNDIYRHKNERNTTSKLLTIVVVDFLLFIGHRVNLQFIRKNNIKNTDLFCIGYPDDFTAIPISSCH